MGDMDTKPRTDQAPIPPAPRVSSCEARECAHNFKQRCFARTVTINDDALCEMFRNSLGKRIATGEVARIIRCAEGSCGHNAGGRCAAEGVTVGNAWGIGCLTWAPH
jgi:hypothetical protein